MDGLVLICGDGHENVALDIQGYISEKYIYECECILPEKINEKFLGYPASFGSESFYSKCPNVNLEDNNIFLYVNMIPNVDTNIINFINMASYFKPYLNNGLLNAVIPYMGYGFNIFNPTFMGFERNKNLFEIIKNSGISNLITINPELFDHNLFLLHSNENMNVESIDMIDDLFEKIDDQENKFPIHLKQKDYSKCMMSDSYNFRFSFILNPYSNSFNFEKIEVVVDQQFVIFLPFMIDYDIINQLMVNFYTHKAKSVEFVTLGISPDERISNLINGSTLISKVITSDVIPLTEKLQNMNKITLVSSLEKISKKIHEIDWI